MRSFRERLYVGEAMDAPDADPGKLRRSYAQLALINAWLSRMAGLLRRHVLTPAARMAGSPTVMEVGCGGGDVLLWLARAARAQGTRLSLVGVDADERALETARKTLAGVPELRLRRATIADLPSLEPADFVFCNHVLHHVPPAEIPVALATLRRTAKRRLLVNDLERSSIAYALFSGLASVAFTDSFVRSDGLLSIRKGFRAHELAAACAEAGFPSATRILRLFPWRVVILAAGEPRIAEDKARPRAAPSPTAAPRL